MYRDTATVVENIQRFLDRVAMNKKVYYLQIESDPVMCESGEGDGIPVMLFFSDAAYARRLKEQSLPETEVAELDLFDLMYKWLPGMLDDGVLAGPNWTGDMVGAEVEPTDLREALEELIGPDLLQEYDQRCEALIKQQEAE